MAACALVLAAVASPMAAARDAETTDPRLAPTSADAARDESRKAIPWNKLSQLDQRRVRYVVNNASLYRRLPTRVEPCSPEVFDFLIRRPEVVTSVWKLMGVSALTIDRESDRVFRAADQLGGRARCEVVYSDRDADARGVTVAVVNGVYHQKPLPRPIKAQCVLLLRSGSTVESNGRRYVTARIDAFVKFDRAAADLVAKTLQPVVARTADHNFVETMKFVSTFSRTAEQNPDGMRRLADRLDGLEPPLRQEMIAVCRQASEQAATVSAARRQEQARLAQLRSEPDGA